MAEPRRNRGTVFSRTGMRDTNTGTSFAYGSNTPIMDRINRTTGVTRASNRAAFNEDNTLTRESYRNMQEAFQQRDSDLAELETRIEALEAQMEWAEERSRSGLAPEYMRRDLRDLYEQRRRLLESTGWRYNNNFVNNPLQP